MNQNPRMNQNPGMDQNPKIAQNNIIYGQEQEMKFCQSVKCTVRTKFYYQAINIAQADVHTQGRKKIADFSISARNFETEHNCRMTKYMILNKMELKWV